MLQRNFFLNLISVFIGFALTFASFLAAANSELSAIRLGQTPDQTRVVFEVKNNQNYKIFQLQNPDRLVIDFYNAKNKLSFKQQAFNDKRIAGMRISEAADKTRVVLDLRENYKFKYFTLAKNSNRSERLVLDLLQPLPAVLETNTMLAAKETSQKPVQVAVTPKAPEKPVQVAKVAEVTKPVQAKPAPAAKPAKEISKANQATEKLLNNNQDFVGRKEFLVAIDPGHGGKDTGAIGPNGTLEKHITLDLARELKRVIDATPGMRAVLTRNKDEFVDLKKRVEIAKQHKADIFISVHADAYHTAQPKGGSVYVLSRNGSSGVMARHLARQEQASLGYLPLAGRDKDVAFVLSDLTREANLRSSHKLGELVLSQMQKSMQVHKSKVQSANFAVLKSIDMPSMLIEAAFISNPQEEQKLKQKSFHNSFALAVTKGLTQFIEQTGTSPLLDGPVYVQHKIRAGDNLSVIAQAYGVSIAEIRRANNIKNPNQLFVGRNLKIPVTANTKLSYNMRYKVRSGDTLSQIAENHKVSLAELKRVNKIENANQLFVGRELLVPVKQPIISAMK